MQVQSPVGTFPLRFRRVHLHRGGITVDTALGAWSSKVTLDRGDVTLVGGALGVLLLSFVAGRASARRGR